MADKRMIYDFETIFEVIMKSQTDMIELVTKWSEMISPTAKDVTFNLEGRAPLTVPNFQKMFETINTRTLPSDPSFNSVTTTSRYGWGKFTNSSLSFAGANGDMIGGTAGVTYSAFGICGTLWGVSGEKTLNSWPVPRYWNVTAAGQAHVHIAPAGIRPGAPQASEFFVIIDGPDRSLKLTLNYHTHEGYQTMVLNCPTGGQPAIWHVIIKAMAQAAGTVVTGSASMLGKGA